MFLSEQGAMQEIAALVLVAGAVLYMVHRMTGWPRPRRRAPEAQTPDSVQMGRGLARGLKKAQRARQRSGDG